MLVRRSYGELKNNHLHQMVDEYGAVCRWNEGEKTLFFPGGASSDSATAMQSGMFCDIRDRSLM